MFNAGIKLAALWFLVRKLKPIWKIIAVSIVSIIFVLIIHSEYLSYLEIKQSTDYLGISYIIKWGLIFLVLILNFYLISKKLYVTGINDEFRPGMPREDGFDDIRDIPTLRRTISNPSKKESLTDKSTNIVNEGIIDLEQADNKKDPFDTIREKPNLETKATKVLNNRYKVENINAERNSKDINDPFDFLRNKNNLEHKVEKILNSPKEPDNDNN